MHNYYLLIFIYVVNTSSGSPRILKYELNPGCGKVCDERNSTTFHLRAEGSNDTLHYLWDFVGNPSVLLAVTSKTAKLNIDWDKYLTRQPKSLNFTEDPFYTFGVTIQKIIEFNDLNDKGSIDNINNNNINILNPVYFNWTRKSRKQSNEFVELDMSGHNYVDPELNISRAGEIEIILNGFCTLEHSDVIPHMLHSENSTQVDFIINHFRGNSSFEKSRFGLELMIVSMGNPSSTMMIDTKKSLDDEYTPGIFETVEMKTPELNTKNKKRESGYLQWRPVSYLTSHRDVTSSTDTIYYNLVNCSNIYNNSLLYAFYGDESNNLLINKINVTIGSSGDGFYKKTNYATWTFLVGYGNPPGEQFSYLVILIISIGVGLPLLIMSIAAIYTCIRRFPRREASRLLNT
ncbi:glycosylated lysosomal membrane protein [Microplitis demolitor]|uniref:glycosylated lysosomal membrane protein n=1 Tax=Microplitis demolitor TaxID=69319 RepID=UPI0004CDA54A|nr:glycosylated lysosomal membrane protein [Microplitis demolitor]